MLTPTPRRILAGVVSGAVLLLIASWLSGSTGEICEQAKSGQEYCAVHNLPAFILLKIGKFLDDSAVVITALATIAIGWFTLTLKRSTDRLWRAGDDQLTLYRLEFNATHRPKLVIRETHMMVPTGHTPTAATRFIVANAGDGAADIVESFVVLEFNENAVLLPLWPPENSNSIGPVRIEPGQGVEVEFGSNINFPQYMNEQNRQRNLPVGIEPTPKIWLRGFIVYLDNNRARRRMSFCRGYDFQAFRFRAGDDPNYEYSD